jgi:predicted O-linked N-acetylglucosamine transferase (SPINDLY family)
MLLKAIFRNLLVRRRPGLAPDWQTRALVLRNSGKLDDAVRLCEQALAANPENTEAINFLAAGLLAAGRLDEGLDCLRRAAALAPSARSQKLLGDVLARAGNFENAISSYRAAIALEPNDAETWNTLAGLEIVAARYDDAEASCRAGLVISPRHAVLMQTLAGVLFEQARVEAAIETIRESLALQPDNPHAHSSLLRMLWYADGYDASTIFREHLEWAARHARPFENTVKPHQNRADPARRLRIGFVSPYLNKHAVTFFLESAIAHFDRKHVEVFFYADVAHPDAYSARLKQQGSHWRNTVSLDDAQLAQHVRDDAIDILVDLSGHTANNRLLVFARKPAPIQVNWLGFPSTTGMSSMDYRITDCYCDPPGMTERFNTETLVRLPGIYMAWRPPENMPVVAPLPALKNGFVTFGMFHSAFKITRTTALLWARILQHLPGARLRVLAVSGVAAERHIRRLFAECRINERQLEILPRLGFDDYLAAYGDVDIALDTFPYHGATTTCFALWMGLPVVALEGSTHASRADVSMLCNAGLQQLVAASADAYVDIAVRLAGNPVELAELRMNLRTMLSGAPNTDGAACARNIEEAFRTMWRTWCDNHTKKEVSAAAAP